MVRTRKLADLRCLLRVTLEDAFEIHPQVRGCGDVLDDEMRHVAGFERLKFFFQVFAQPPIPAPSAAKSATVLMPSGKRTAWKP